jgi:transketolase
MIVLRTHIAQGAPNAQDTAKAHGAPLGEDEIRATKRVYGWPEDEHFLVPDDVREHMDHRPAGAEASAAWRERFEEYRRAEPQLAAELERVLSGRLPEGWERSLPTFSSADGAIATRASSAKVLNAVAQAVPELVGGSADLAESTLTLIEGSESVRAGHYEGRNFHFGIREHGMGAILNGLILHRGFRGYGATFLIFSDYMRPSVRLAALTGIPAIYVWTHDSVWLGEDGPTHQPIEHFMSLRAMPQLYLLRPCDANEVAQAWRVAVERKDGPCGLALTRQALPTLDRGGDIAPAEGVLRGGYVLADAKGTPDAIVLATGSEVHDALAARETLAGEGIGVRVVSMPCWELFEQQDQAYRDEVLPPAVTARVSVEAGITFGWERWVGPAGRSVGIDRFGASAPGKVVARALGISPEAVVAAVREVRGDG